MMTAAMTALTARGDDRQKFPTTQLVLIFNDERDVIGQNQGPCNKFSLTKARYILSSLLGYLD
jgi:hypothetical protein